MVSSIVSLFLLLKENNQLIKKLNLECHIYVLINLWFEFYQSIVIIQRKFWKKFPKNTKLLVHNTIKSMSIHAIAKLTESGEAKFSSINYFFFVRYWNSWSYLEKKCFSYLWTTLCIL